MSYLKSLQSLTPSITAAGGTPLIISAEPAENVEKSRAASGYTGAAISDPDNFIASQDARTRIRRCRDNAQEWLPAWFGAARDPDYPEGWEGAVFMGY